TKRDFQEHFDSRAQLIRRMFSAEGFFGRNDVLLFGCLYNQWYQLYAHVRAYRLHDQMTLLAGKLNELVASVSAAERLRHQEYFEFVPEGQTSSRWGAGSSDNAVRSYKKATALWWQIGLALPASIRRRVPQRTKDLLRALLQVTVGAAYDSRSFLRVLWRSLSRRSAADNPPPAIAFSPLVHHEAAKVYYARGQIEQALLSW